MVARGRTLGAMTLATDQSGGASTSSDLDLAEELARRCGMAVDNARLFAERAYIARTLQQSLLPPSCPTSRASRPPRASAHRRGERGRRRLLRPVRERRARLDGVMGDVCGKGPTRPP